jgi:hypothetical protein
MNNNMANMVPMGGPVGGPPMMNNGAMPQQGGGQQRQQQTPADKERDNRTLLNTYIYEYFLRYGMYDCARAILNSDQQVKVTKEGGGRRDENGNPIGNGLGDDAMDHDAKDDAGDQKRPDDLPTPLLPMPLQDSAFLYEWFCLFWDMLQAQRGNGSSRQVNQYVNQQQVCLSFLMAVSSVRPVSMPSHCRKLTGAHGRIILRTVLSISRLCFDKCTRISRIST